MNENFWDEKEENYIRNNESNDFEMIKPGHQRQS